MKNEDGVIEEMAKVGHNTMFCEEWDDLHPNSIERALWKQIAKAMLDKFRELWGKEYSK